MEPVKKIKPNPGKYYNIDNLIAFRRKMHSYPEIGFQEFVTRESIKEYLLKIDVPESVIKTSGKTGWTVDLYGKAAPQGEDKFIALRADIDALSMTEANEHLEYRSTTENDHACGHDGHTATMLGFVSHFQDNIEKIPSNKGVRILFQPSEEGPGSGAKAMLEDNCLEGVSECYGYHNWPTHPVGYCMVKPGAQMAAVAVITIDLIGKGGHGSTPEKCIDPVQMGVQFHQKFAEMKETKFKGRPFVCTMPKFNCGERYNVIAQSAQLEGTLRSFEPGFSQEFEEALTQILEEIKAEFKGDYKLNYFNCFDAVINDEEKTSHVIRIAKEQFGEDKVGSFDMLPVRASEDFSFFIQKVPGCYLFLGSGRKFNDTMLHDCSFDFNDELLEHGAKFFWNLVQDRLEL